METLTFEEKHKQREIEALEQLDDETLEQLRSDAMANHEAIGQLIANITRIQDERAHEVLF